MANHVTKQEFVEAYDILFGYSRDMAVDLLSRLQPSEIKAAYRKKAFETHPDRSQIVGNTEADLNEQFRVVTLAYEVLTTALKVKGPFDLKGRKGVRQRQKTRPRASGEESRFSDRFYSGMIPRRRLLIGQFLYYCGIISWKTLIDAIIWQKRQRPPIGQIAIKWGILSQEEIRHILIERSVERDFSKRFAEYARQKGYITIFEHMALVGKQRSLQNPIGEYFIENEILYPRDMSRKIMELRNHNRWVMGF